MPKKQAKSKKAPKAVKKVGGLQKGHLAKAQPKPPKGQAQKAQSQQVTISAAKGRPMLVWVGKRPLRQVTAFPAQHVETFSPRDGVSLSVVEGWLDWPKQYPHGGLLFHGDNKEVLAHLLANGFRGKVKLIYIDPPFDSGADYVRKVQLRGIKGTAKIDGETYSRRDLTTNEMVLLDLYYIEHHTIFFDLEILFNTIPVVLFGKGAY